MNGNKSAVFDSNILIYISKNRLDMRALAARYDSIFVSVITYVETLGFKFEDEAEQEIIERWLGKHEIVQTDMDIARQVVAYKQIRKIKTPDALILATAKVLGAELVTMNEADFAGIDSDVDLFVPILR